MRALLGIGNPGPTYALTRHNVGWLVLDAIAETRSLSWIQGAGPFLETHAVFAGTACALVKPLTFVNLSGRAALAVSLRYGLTPSDFLIIVDDIHLPLGELRVRQGGSAGGHNGLLSLEEHFGAHKAPRLRIGIGAPPQFGALVAHVLSPFTPEEKSILRDVIRDAAMIADAFGGGGYAAAVTANSQRKRNDVPPSADSATTPT